jgi:hypothetical protein
MGCSGQAAYMCCYTFEQHLKMPLLPCCMPCCSGALLQGASHRQLAYFVPGHRYAMMQFCPEAPLRACCLAHRVQLSFHREPSPVPYTMQVIHRWLQAACMRVVLLTSCVWPAGARFDIMSGTCWTWMTNFTCSRLRCRSLESIGDHCSQVCGRQTGTWTEYALRGMPSGPHGESEAAARLCVCQIFAGNDSARALHAPVTRQWHCQLRFSPGGDRDFLRHERIGGHTAPQVSMTCNRSFRPMKAWDGALRCAHRLVQTSPSSRCC